MKPESSLWAQGQSEAPSRGPVAVSGGSPSPGISVSRGLRPLLRLQAHSRMSGEQGSGAERQLSALCGPCLHPAWPALLSALPPTPVSVCTRGLAMFKEEWGPRVRPRCPSHKCHARGARGWRAGTLRVRAHTVCPGECVLAMSAGMSPQARERT